MEITKFIPIIDPGIYTRDANYNTLVTGLDQNVFVKDLNGVDPYLGQVWPGPTYYPDWFSENTTYWWTNELKNFHNMAEYDGLWIDMNEISNFCNVDGKGQVCTTDPDVNCDGSTDCCLICSTPDPMNEFDFPPFTPHCSQGSLSTKTFAMSATHSNGVKEYDSHNLYGFMESIATQSALESILSKRAFIVSRSTFAGSGKYASHWTGDNAATWEDLAASIVTMNNMALFGIPMVGADICGFLGNTTAELCSRWIQVGAFSPFSRNHNGLGDAPQELYRWDSVADTSRTVLGLRYRLLPYLYTLMYNAHTLGDTVLNAMWMHYPTDRAAFYRNGQYMWSNGILFTPVLQEGASSVEGYFPLGKWYSLFDDLLIDATSQGIVVGLETPLLQTNAHVRGGTIIPMQEFEMTTADARKTPFTLVVALDVVGASSGSLYMDDGESIDLTTYSQVNYAVTTDKAGSILMTSKVSASLYQCPECTIHQIKFFGVSAGQCSASLSTDDDLIMPTSSVITEGSTPASYSTLTLTFDSVNIITEFSIQVDCFTSSSSDDGNGFESLPYYAQIVIIATSVVFGLAIVFVASKVYYFNSVEELHDYDKKDDAIPSFNDPLLNLDEDEEA